MALPHSLSSFDYGVLWGALWTVNPCWPRSFVGLQRPDVGLVRSGGPVAAERTSQHLTTLPRQVVVRYIFHNESLWIQIRLSWKTLKDDLRVPMRYPKISQAGALRQGHSLRRGRRWFWQAILDEGPRWARGNMMKGAWSVTLFSGVYWPPVFTSFEDRSMTNELNLLNLCM